MRIDRIQLVVPSLAPATAAWERLLGAESVGEDSVEALGARRAVLALGESEVELLTPTADGAVADFLARRRGGLFAAGIAVADVQALEARLGAEGVAAQWSGEQLLLSPEALGIPGLRLVVSPGQERRRVGRARFLYEVTHLCVDAAESARRFARLFDLSAEHFVPIRSPEYGYEGTLTLFHPDRLDRLEIIHPFDASRTMGRYFTKHGPCLYMAYAESDETDAVRAACLAHAPGDFTGPRETAVPDNLFLHPRALGGMMLGVSRTTFAWSWSGRPARVQPPPR